jgi:hypothetical protein
MSYLLFAPDNVKALKSQVVPEGDDPRPIFGHQERVLILGAASSLSRDTYVLCAEALGGGPTCLPLDNWTTASREQ